MIGRRNLLVGAASLAVFGAARRETAILTDGFINSRGFSELDLADDLEGARKEAFCVM
jgi:hypothetical protein